MAGVLRGIVERLTGIVLGITSNDSSITVNTNTSTGIVDLSVASGTGTVTSVTNADGTLTISPTTGVVVASIALGNANTWTGQQTFEATSSSTVGMIVEGASSQTANLTNWKNSGGTVQSFVDASGRFMVGTTPAITLNNTITGFGAHYTGGRYISIIAGSLGTGIFFDNTGYFSIYAAASTSDDGASQTISFKTFGSTLNTIIGASLYDTTDPGFQLLVQTSTSSKIALVVQGASGQSADLQQWQDSSSNIWEGIGAANVTANTSFDGLYLVNPTVASTGNQSFSPRIRLTGQGWKTTATAASQTVDWIVENQPVQGAANPTANLVFSSQVNAGGYTPQFSFTSSGNILAPNTGSASNCQYSFYGLPGFGLYYANDSHTVLLAARSIQVASFNAGSGTNSGLSTATVGALVLAPVARVGSGFYNGATNNYMLVTAPADTTLTASTESIGVNFNLSATRQFATGALTTQREFVVQAPTYAFVGASTITNASTLNITGAPIVGTNATITNRYILTLGSTATPLLSVGATGILGIGLAGTQTGIINFNGTTSGTVTLSTADAAGTWTMKLPTTGGTANYFLQTDGSGNTTWAAGGGGSIPQATFSFIS